MNRPNYVRPHPDWWKRLEDEWKQGRLIEAGDIENAVSIGIGLSRRSGTSEGRSYRTHHHQIRSFNLVRRVRSSVVAAGPRHRVRVPHAARRVPLGRQAERRLHQKVAYIAREGRWASAKPDLVASGGIGGDELVKVMKALVDTSHRQDASLFHDIVVELPKESNKVQQVACLEQISKYLASRELPSMWAIHSHGQPHVHLLVSVRRCHRNAEGQWIASEQGRRGKKMPRHLDGPDKVKEWRLFVATVINHFCRPATRFHSGRRAETGAAGPAERRLPMSKLHERRSLFESELRERFLGLAQELQRQKDTECRAETALLPSESPLTPTPPMHPSQVLPRSGGRISTTPQKKAPLSKIGTVTPTRPVRRPEEELLEQRKTTDDLIDKYAQTGRPEAKVALLEHVRSLPQKLLNERLKETTILVSEYFKLLRARGFISSDEGKRLHEVYRMMTVEQQRRRHESTEKLTPQKFGRPGGFGRD
ncbi:MobA/MobL family protein [Ferrovibrio sp.]|uniref:MobA/MobL family protein n=1 Tax=Ferrovibrio sp. TaxID=1917215 RepID=UPI003D115A16